MATRKRHLRKTGDNSAELIDQTSKLSLREGKMTTVGQFKASGVVPEDKSDNEMHVDKTGYK